VSETTLAREEDTRPAAMRRLALFWQAPGVRRLVGAGLALEAFLLTLWVIIPAASVSLSVSPLARVWPWLLAPARLALGDALVSQSLPPANGLQALFALGIALVGASCAAALALHIAPQVRLSRRGLLALALVGAALFGLTMALLPSLPSDDIFSYILYGRISGVHGANPLISTPADFANDPFLSLVFWRDVRSVYGSVWLLLSAALSLVAQGFGGSLALYVALFKLLGLVAHLTNAWLIWRILGRLAPDRQFQGTLLYAWNPLCLLEFCASGHNDAVMLTLLLLAVYWLLREWELPALVAFGLSISIKYVPIVLLPFFLALVARRMRANGASWQQVGGAVAWRIGVVAGVIVLTALPFWAGPATLGALLLSPPAQQLGNSPAEAISWPLRALAQAVGLSHDAARNLVNTGLKVVGLLIFAALWLWEFRRARSIEGMLDAWGWTLLWYVLIASGWFWPWYATWGIAVVALTPWRLLARVTVLFSAGVLTLYTFQSLHALGIYGYRSLVAFGPTLVVLALVLVRRLGWFSWPEMSHWRQGDMGQDVDRIAPEAVPSGEIAPEAENQAQNR
jgi:GPI-GlcNAc transferase complex PIG-U subunit